MMEVLTLLSLTWSSPEVVLQSELTKIVEMPLAPQFDMGMYLARLYPDGDETLGQRVESVTWGTDPGRGDPACCHMAWVHMRNVDMDDHGGEAILALLESHGWYIAHSVCKKRAGGVEFRGYRPSKGQ